MKTRITVYRCSQWGHKGTASPAERCISEPWRGATTIPSESMITTMSPRWKAGDDTSPSDWRAAHHHHSASALGRRHRPVLPAVRHHQRQRLQRHQGEGQRLRSSSSYYNGSTGSSPIYHNGAVRSSRLHRASSSISIIRV
ncbi:hypothetical protein WMY93_022685 [Mugilogobius chulae]|uniref:Uncharacterized protein n=1 Tax=Mugilogobius chulae TaxID=88201 RepID=A0AAW0N8T3_9GOBI